MKHIEMDAVNRNGLWCSIIADALADAGVREVVVSPGGRAAALAFSLALQPELRCLGHIDERSGAFMALGMVQVTGLPAAICTTSGSAVANLLPALTEAHARGLPLILLTCDRPRSTRARAAPQSTDPVGICAPLVRAQLDLEDPEDSQGSLLALRERVLGLVRASTHPASAGPVHINIPQPGWLCSTEPNLDWQPADSAASIRRLPLLDTMPPAGGEVDLAAVCRALNARPGLRGLIVAGPDSPLAPAALAELAAGCGYPLVADMPSQYRRPAVADVICQGDALALHPLLEAGQIDLLIRLGAAPVASTLQQYLARARCPVLRILRRDSGADFISPAYTGLVRPEPRVLAELAGALGPGDAEWKSKWTAAADSAQERCREFVRHMPWGEVQAAERIVNADGYDLLFLANSMSVRHGNLLARPRAEAQRVLAHRGVNGIDGTLGAFIGALAADGGRGLLLLGDQAMTHDLPALANPLCRSLRGVICIMNNAGGGIFDLIACSRLEGYREVMRNRPAIDFEPLARAFELPFRRCCDAASLEAALAWGRECPGLSVIEVVVPAQGMAGQVRSLYRTLLGA